MEGIAKHLPELRASLGIMTEEGGALIGQHSMKAENRLATCASFSAMWDGQPLDRWRAGDGVESYTGRRFSAHTLVQPVAAEALLSDPMASGQGLLAGFLTCRPASRTGTRLRMERDAEAETGIARFAARIRLLLSRDLPLADANRNELLPTVLSLSPGARDVLTAFAREVEKAQASGGPFKDARAFASKTAEHAARLSAVLTIYANPDAPEVTGETMAGATEIATFYANEAARLADAAIVPPEVADAERMRLWLLRSWGESCISAGIAAQRGPLKVTDRARKALQRLQGHGWLIEANGAEVAGKSRKEAWRIVCARAGMTGFTFDAKAALEAAQKCQTLPNRSNRSASGGAGLGGIGALGTVPVSDPEMTTEQLARDIFEERAAIREFVGGAGSRYCRARSLGRGPVCGNNHAA
ncbi:DUF3987 domain-containing protein [Roseovarius sp. E0-M6]|uniref:DUF3987 domain-containing protein n=1 Tax=Roseovarius sp. E0-M6 TaxID=3127118 RepID=UPI00300F85A8